MKKRLRAMGNGYGIIIDASIRRLLGIGKRAVLQVTTDGRRIIIEPTGELLDDDMPISRRRALLAGEDVVDASVVDGVVNRRELEIEAPRIWDELERRWGLSPARIAALYHGVPRITRVAAWLQSRGAVVNATDEELATVLRIRCCYQRMCAGDGWDQAIEHALRMFPKHVKEPSVAVQQGAAAGPP